MPIRYNFLLALETGRTPILPELLLTATSDNTLIKLTKKIMTIKKR